MDKRVIYTAAFSVLMIVFICVSVSGCFTQLQVTLPSNGKIEQNLETQTPTPPAVSTLKPTPTSSTDPTSKPTTYPSSTPESQNNTYTDPNTETISFSGYIWDVYNSGLERLWNPGPNHFSCNPKNIWVDSNGWLHLKITCINGTWHCSELAAQQALGYGIYTFEVSNNYPEMDKNMVLGLFAYKDDANEIDIEFTTWSGRDVNNTWFTVQPAPYTIGFNKMSFKPQLIGDFSTHSFTWAPDYVHFESVQGTKDSTAPLHSRLICQFNSTVSPPQTGATAHINLWLYKGQVPSDLQEFEIVIKSFTFTPLH